jgi:peptide/nickel transport system substrate-binding protein
MRRNVHAILGVLLVALALAGCGASAPASAPAASATTAVPAASGQITLKVGRPEDGTSFDPINAGGNPSLWSQQQVIGMLVSNAADGKSLEPFIAKSWQTSTDGKLYTFSLRPEAKFCDGSPITAGDVKFSLDRAMTNEKSTVKWQFPSNPKVAVIDPTQFTITLNQPNAAFLSYLTLWGTGILSEKYVKEHGEAALVDQPLGSSAFCLQSWKKGQQLVLERNRYFWVPAQPYVDVVEVRTIPDDNTRILELQAGTIDIAIEPSYNQLTALKDDPNIQPKTLPLVGLAAIVPNVARRPELADPNVRLAMNYAVDRQAMIDAMLFGYGTPAKSFLAEGVLYWTGDFGYGFDLAKAQQLLAASKYPNGFKAELIIPSGDTLAEQSAVILKDQLAKIKIDLTITPLEAGARSDRWRQKRDFDLMYKVSTQDILDPAENIPFDLWAQAEGGADGAYGGFYDPALSKLSQQAEGEMDTNKRAKLYYDLQKQVMAEAPQIYLFHPANRWAVRKNVAGFEIPATGLYRFWTVQIQQG